MKRLSLHTMAVLAGAVIWGGRANAQPRSIPERVPNGVIERPQAFRPRPPFRYWQDPPSSIPYQPLPRRWEPEDEWEDAERVQQNWENRLPPDEYQQTILQALTFPKEVSLVPKGRRFAGVDVWTQIGAGDNRGDSRYHDSGRLSCAAYAYDNATSSNILWVGAVKGGLWKPILLGIFPLWIRVNANMAGSPSVGAFLVKPGDSNHILIGTGNFNREGGDGLYYTEDGGTSWNRAAMSPTPGAFFNIILDRRDATQQTVFAAADNGIWRSLNFGRSWTRVYSGLVTSLVQNPVSPIFWYAGCPGVGVLESSTAGDEFHPVNGTGRQGINGTIGRVGLTLCNSDPRYLYAIVERNGNLNNIYRSSNYGYNWTPIDTVDMIGSGQGNHACAIAVDPNNPNRLFCGMAGMQWTENATDTDTPVSWYRNGPPNSDAGHADQTGFLFQPGTNTVIITNDGGYYAFDYSTRTVNGNGNLYGLNNQQVGNMEAARTDPDLLLGGLQDNGIVRVHAGRNPTLKTYRSGDGGGASISPDDANKMAWSEGAYPDGFHRFYTPGGDSGPVSEITGSLGQNPWANTMLIDPRPGRGANAYVYTNADQYLWYKPLSTTLNWARVNNGNPLPYHTGPAGNQLGIARFDVSMGDPNTFYVSRWADDQVFVFEGATLGSLGYVDRTPTLPTGSQLRDSRVYADRSTRNPGRVYYTTGTSRPSRAFLGEDRGRRWTDVTGDLTTGLPNANYNQLIAHPASSYLLFLATDVGLFRSDNGGRNWYRFMNGLPDVTDVSCISITYDLAANPVMHIGTWGRGWWERSLPSPYTFLVAGSIVLPSALNQAQTLTFEFRSYSGDTFIRTVQLDKQGGFQIGDIPPDNYVLAVKGSKWLRRTGKISTLQGDVYKLNIALIPGDANEDNSVDIFDLATLAEAFNTTIQDKGYNDQADFNCDYSVDIYDLALLAEYFNTEGDK